MSLTSKNSPIGLLSYGEYLNLSGNEKTRYFAQVSQQLEDRQHKIREQMGTIRQGRRAFG